MARQSNFSKYHFHRIFQSSVGMTVTEYIRNRRLANASVALLHTSERILDIALYYQFESQESFTRAFKEVYKLPPASGNHQSKIRLHKANYTESKYDNLSSQSV
ncbi:helix-turn-helix domain-containing protein [Lysinibacillus sp. NPDC092081]|uniref:helix-turn-helix domain-containing protein n=1 Tax=Lysinibacillus sp. NPDC092081 TaxID=3364131 RepID=UPI00381407A3